MESDKNLVGEATVTNYYNSRQRTGLLIRRSLTTVGKELAKSTRRSEEANLLKFYSEAARGDCLDVLPAGAEIGITNAPSQSEKLSSMRVML